MEFVDIHRQVERYYSDRLANHGPTARGVDWNSSESQHLRFEQLLTICPNSSAQVSITDYGCGYGALVDYLVSTGRPFRYQGYDLSASMIAKAEELHGSRSNCTFTNSIEDLTPTEYTVASGIFNVKLDTSDAVWQEYLRMTLDRLWSLSLRGLSFNALTTYSDVARRRPDLYYADPLLWFDYCETNLSRLVALLHDYPLYEFTITVNRGEA